MKFVHAQLLPEFDAVHALTSRDRVIVKRMTKKEAERLRGEELEKYMLSPIDIEGIIGVLAWSACDDEGRRRFVAVKRKKTTRVANVK